MTPPLTIYERAERAAKRCRIELSDRGIFPGDEVTQAWARVIALEMAGALDDVAGAVLEQ